MAIFSPRFCEKARAADAAWFAANDDRHHRLRPLRKAEMPDWPALYIGETPHAIARRPELGAPERLGFSVRASFSDTEHNCRRAFIAAMRNDLVGIYAIATDEMIGLEPGNDR